MKCEYLIRSASVKVSRLEVEAGVATGTCLLVGNRVGTLGLAVADKVEP